jgi:hypothetical protein
MAKTEALTDAFASADTSLWETADTPGAWNANITVTAGQLVSTCTSGYLGQIRSVAAYDLTDSYIECEIVSRPTTGGDNSTEMYFGARSTVDSTDEVRFIISGSSFLNWGQRLNNADVVGSTGSLAYNATNHKWLRIRHRGTKVYFEAGPDGRTWTILGSAALNAEIDLTSVKPYFMTGYWGTQAAPGTGVYDNFNLAPYAPDLLTADTGQASATSATITTTAAYPAGSSVIVVAAYRTGATVTNASFTCTATGLTFAQDVISVVASSNGLVIFSAHNIAALASGSTITVSGPTSTTKVAAVASNWTNLATTSTKDVSQVNPANAAAAVTAATYTSNASATTTQASDLAIGGVVLNIDVTGTITPTSLWATVGDIATAGGTNTTNARAYMQARVLTATGAQTSNPTGTSRAYRSGVVTYKVAAQGGGAVAPTNQFFAFF